MSGLFFHHLAKSAIKQALSHRAEQLCSIEAPADAAAAFIEDETCKPASIAAARA